MKMNGASPQMLLLYPMMTTKILICEKLLKLKNYIWLIVTIYELNRIFDTKLFVKIN